MILKPTLQEEVDTQTKLLEIAEANRRIEQEQMYDALRRYGFIPAKVIA